MNKFYSMIGMARKCGKVTVGFDATTLIVKKRKAFVVIIAEDASEKTKKNMIFHCNNNSCMYIIKGKKEKLGNILGKKYVSIAAIAEKNIASYLINKNNSEVIE